jgi:hypothetical protein
MMLWMEKVLSIGMMVVTILGSSKTIKSMVMVCIHFQMVVVIMVLY